MKKTIKCETCGKNSETFITIDDEDNNVTCGVSGIVGGSNIRIINGCVFCAKCGLSLYKNIE